MKKRKIVFILSAFLLFGAGFFTHAAFFPYVLFNTFGTPTKIEENQTKKNDIELLFSTSTRYADYKKGGFNPNAIVSKKGNRLIIVNRERDVLMNLTSNNPLLTTDRGLGYTEALTAVFPKDGTFIVTDKNNPQLKLKVVVLP